MIRSQSDIRVECRKLDFYNVDHRSKFINVLYNFLFAYFYSFFCYTDVKIETVGHLPV